MYSITTEENVRFANLPLPTFVPRRYRPGNLGTWSGHLAFANDLISAIRPSLLVELGTHYGESYFGFCQSVSENSLDCLCYAVDHWLGEAHAGFYGEEVFEEVSQHNDAYYKSFSYLLRTSFDTALERFGDEAIDLLHIDGLHTYEAVSGDFRAWLPKVRPGGIVLLHDTVVRHVDFGVWRLWDELKVEFSETFEFHHSWGLGVLRKPGHGVNEPALLDTLFRSSPDIREQVRRHYIIYASHLENLLDRREKGVPAQPPPTQERNPTTQVQIFLPNEGGYSEDRSVSQEVEFGLWSKLNFDFEDGLGDGPLRIDPADCPCVIEVVRVSVVSSNSGSTLWSAEDPATLRALVFSGSVMVLPGEDKCVLFSYGNDPRFQIPVSTGEKGAVGLTISLRINQALDAVSKALNAQIRACAESREKCSAIESEIAHVRGDLKTAQTEGTASRREIRMLEQLLESTRLRLQQESSKLVTAHHEIEQRTSLSDAREEQFTALKNSLESDLTALRGNLEHEKLTRMAMERSRSWRLTKPLRRFMRLLRPRKPSTL